MVELVMGKDQHMARAVSDMPLPPGRSRKCKPSDDGTIRAPDRPHDQKSLADDVS